MDMRGALKARAALMNTATFGPARLFTPKRRTSASLNHRQCVLEEIQSTGTCFVLRDRIAALRFNLS
jgi:hypothetical protein